MNATIFLAGVTATAFSASGLFFFKFWKASQDRFFLWFGFACELIALERVVAFFVEGLQDPIRSPLVETSSWVYVLRLLAFLVIMAAIYQKNHPQKNA